MKGYKGFDKNLKCRDFQYEIGKTYEMDGEIGLCERGFHFCENPRDVFDYYRPIKGNRFCLIEAEDVLTNNHITLFDSKRVCRKITIVKEITISEMVDIAANMYKDKYESNHELHSIDINDGAAITSLGRGKLSEVGDYGVSASGDFSMSISKEYSSSNSCTRSFSISRNNSTSNSGNDSISKSDWGSCSNSGYNGISISNSHSASNSFDNGFSKSDNHSVSNSGDFGCSVVDDYSAANSGIHGISHSGDHSVSNSGFAGESISEDFSVSASEQKGESVSGFCGISTSLDEGSSFAKECGVAIAINGGLVKGKIGTILVAREVEYFTENEIPKLLDYAMAVVDGVNYIPDTWYKLANGKLVEA